MFSLTSLITAGVVAVTVTAISLIPNQRLKALVYSLPIPITILIIATGGQINISHVYGLFLVTGFLWLVYLQKSKLKVPIILAIIFAAAAYVGAGILLEPTRHAFFWVGAGVFVIWWLIFVSSFYQSPKIIPGSSRSRKIIHRYYYPLQASSIFVIVVGLLSIVKLLAGAVVAFPLNGIFTTYVMKENLKTLASEFSRNSIGLLLLLIIIYIGEDQFGLILSIIIGWVLCFIVFVALNPNLLRRPKIAESIEH